ncbi:AlpA family phage regulatory protein [Photobacterium sagamiensis]|uniref:helix-turn-helix transcriptional regulator n=1 Tax=Photobacterium sagamiensis TaxID=2910241 RepID=UPI003D0DDE9D
MTRENVTRSTIWRWIRDGAMPQQHTIGGETVGCSEDVIEKWSAERQVKKTGVTSFRSGEAWHLLELFLTGRRLTRGDIQMECGHQDANQLLHVLRNEMLVPVTCQKGRGGLPSVWYMKKEDIDMYQNHRTKQKKCQKRKLAQRDEANSMKKLHQWVEEIGEDEFIQLIKEVGKKK